MAQEDRPTVTVDREYYAAVTRAVRYAGIALQPGAHLNEMPYDDTKRARLALLDVSGPTTDRWHGIIPEVPGGCVPALTRAELELETEEQELQNFKLAARALLGGGFDLNELYILVESFVGPAED